MRWLSHDTLFRGHSFFLIVFLRLFSTWSSVCVNFSCRCIPLNFTKLIRVFFKETEKKNRFQFVNRSRLIHVADSRMVCSQVIDRTSICEWMAAFTCVTWLTSENKITFTWYERNMGSLSYRVFWFDDSKLSDLFTQEFEQCSWETEHIWWWRQKKTNRRVFPWNIALFSRLQSEKMLPSSWK